VKAAPKTAPVAVDTQGRPIATGHYLVMLKGNADPTTVASAHRKRDGMIADRAFRHAFRGFAAKLNKAQRAALLADPNVAAVVPDEVVEIEAQSIPTGVSRIGTPTSALSKINGLDERVDADVAIVDTGIGPHSDLNIAGGYNCSSSDRTRWYDENGHGTHVAGTVGAKDNSWGVVGVAPGVRLWAVRILNSSGAGLLSWYVCGLDWILAQRDPNDSSRPMIEAVNMSVAKTGSDDANCGRTNKDILHQAICRLYAAGITVVAAAANASKSAAGFVPAAYNEAITVSALADTDGRPGGGGGNKCYSWGTYDRDDTFADFSNYGSDVDLIAPGKCILSTKPGPTYAYSSGTSMAAPHVTGAVALYKASRPLATPSQVRESLRYLGNLNWYTNTDPTRTTSRCSTCRGSAPSARSHFAWEHCDDRVAGRHGAGAVQRVPQLDLLRARAAQRLQHPEPLDGIVPGAEPLRLDGDERDDPGDRATGRPTGHVSPHGHRDELGPNQVDVAHDQRRLRQPDRTRAGRNGPEVEHAESHVDRRDDRVDAGHVGCGDRPVRHDRRLRGRAERQRRRVWLDGGDERIDPRSHVLGTRRRSRASVPGPCPGQ
jgi:hypothetical protein